MPSNLSVTDGEAALIFISLLQKGHFGDVPFGKKC